MPSLGESYGYTPYQNDCRADTTSQQLCGECYTAAMQIELHQNISLFYNTIFIREGTCKRMKFKTIFNKI